MTPLLEVAPPPPGRAADRPLRLAVIVNMVAPYTRPLFELLALRDECDLLVVSETTMERDRRWRPETRLRFQHELLDSWTLNLAPLAVGSGFRTRFDTYLYVPKRPLRALVEFAPDVVVAGGGGIWSSPANLAALATRRRHGWAFVPWWGSFTRPRPTLPRRLANPWVRRFMRASDAWLVYGTRHLEDVVALGAARERVVVAPLTALPPDRPIVARTAHGGPVRYLFVGRLIERKGVAALLEAFRHVRGGELWIAGDGPLRPLVDAASAADPRLRVLGHLEGDALSDLYASADVLVVPSLYEPWGLVVHEGLSHGLPVVTTHEVGAADDLIEDGANGALTPPGDVQALASAMNDVGGWTAERRERGAQRSVEKLARCTLERAAAGFLHASALAVSHREVFPREHAP